MAIKKLYLISIIAPVLFGVLYGFCLAIVFDARQLYLLSVIGALITGLLIAFINAIYFLPVARFEIRFVLPGIITTALFTLIWGKTEGDALFFIPVGMLNLILGLLFYVHKRRRLKKE